MVTVISEGAGVFSKTALEQGSLMITVNEAVAVCESTWAVRVIEFELTSAIVASLIVTLPLTLSAFSAFVIKAKEGLRDQVGFWAQFRDLVTA